MYNYNLYFSIFQGEDGNVYMTNQAGEEIQPIAITNN